MMPILQQIQLNNQYYSHCFHSQAYPPSQPMSYFPITLIPQPNMSYLANEMMNINQPIAYPAIEIMNINSPTNSPTLSRKAHPPSHKVNQLSQPTFPSNQQSQPCIYSSSQPFNPYPIPTSNASSNPPPTNPPPANFLVES